MDGYITIETQLNTKSFEKQIADLENELKQIDYELSKKKELQLDTRTIKDYQLRAEKLTNQLIELREKQEELDSQGMPNINQMTSDIANKTESIIRKVAKWGLAIFSVRSAYVFIRQSVSTLSQYNEKIGADIEYIRYALASALQPIIENIIQLMYKMLAYINYISQAWFGVNIFANASAKAFGNVKKNLGGANKQAKELQKTLLGFDEMNILQDGSTTQGGGGGGITLPSYDLKNMEDVEIPSWIKWIAENGPTVALILGSIGAALIGIKLAPFLSGILGVTEGLGKFKAGISLVLSGLVLLAGEIINLVLNWDEMDNKQKALAFGIAALGATLVTLGLTIAGLSGGLSLLITGIVALTTALVGLIIKNQEDEKSTLSAAEASKELKNAKDKLRESTNRYTSAVDNAKKSSDELKKAEEKLKKATGDYTITGEKLFSSILAGTKQVEKLTPEEMNLYKAYLSNQSAQKELNEANKELNESRKESIDKAEQETAAIYKETGQYNEYFKEIIDGYNKKTVSESQMLTATAEIYSKLDEEAKKTFAENLPDNIKKAIESNSNLVEVLDNGVEVPLKEISNASKKTFETDMPNSLSKTNTAIDKTIKKLSSLTGALSGSVSGGLSISVNGKKVGNAKGAIYYPPKLATGGIINMPGRGVPLGAIGGERGAEGVIPLTDSQMMAQLGEAIGKNVVINAILNNYMNSRLMNREMLKTENITDFAFNR